MRVQNSPQALEIFQKTLKRAIVLDYRNVAEYFFEVQGAKPKGWTLHDFPSVMPPFPCMWLESRTPDSYKNSPVVKAKQGIKHIKSSGTLLLTDDLAPAKEASSRLRALLSQLSEGWNIAYRGQTKNVDGRDLHEFAPLHAPDSLFEDGRYTGEALDDELPVRVIVGLIIQEDGSGALVFNAMFAYLVGAKGELVSRLLCFATSPTLQQANQGRHFRDIISAEAYPVMLAISFCHCKNISMQEIEPPQKLARAFAKRNHGVGMTTYRTLVIDGIKRTLAEEGDVKNNGLQKALHLVRGHFAEWTEEKPLFGKVVGKFWIPFHARGNRARGVAQKDYSVKPQRTDEDAVAPASAGEAS